MKPQQDERRRAGSVAIGYGRRVGVRAYVAGYQLARHNPDLLLRMGFDGWPATGREILAEFRQAFQTRINRHMPHYGQGRKWDPDWQAETLRAARELNTPRLRIYWLPKHLRDRFENRIVRTREI